MVEGFLAYLSGLDGDGEVLFGVGLPDEIFQTVGPQRHIWVFLLEVAGDQPLGHLTLPTLEISGLNSSTQMAYKAPNPL